MNKIIELKSDFKDVSACLARARREVKEEKLEYGQKHYIYFKAPKYNDLVIIEFVKDKWQVRKCTFDEWEYYFKTYLQ